MPAAIFSWSALSLAGKGNVPMSSGFLRRVEVAGQRPGHLDRHPRLAVGHHLRLLLEGGAVRVGVEVAALLEVEIALVDLVPLGVGERLLAVLHVLREVRVVGEGGRRRDRVRDQLRDPGGLQADRDRDLARLLDLLARGEELRVGLRELVDARVLEDLLVVDDADRRGARRPDVGLVADAEQRARALRDRLDPALVAEVREQAARGELLHRHRAAVAGPHDEHVRRAAGPELRAQRGLELVGRGERRLDRDVRVLLLVGGDQLLPGLLVVGDRLHGQRVLVATAATSAAVVARARATRRQRHRERGGDERGAGASPLEHGLSSCRFDRQGGARRRASRLGNPYSFAPPL